MSENDVLAMLGNAADEELKNSETKNKSRRKKNKGAQNRKTAEYSKGYLSEEKSEPNPSDTASASREDPFRELAEEMLEQGTAITRQSEEPRGKDEKKQPEKSARDLRPGSGKLGEEITKEHAEQLMSNKDLGGRRAKIIVRTKVIDSTGKTVAKSEEEQPEPEEEAVPRKYLVREDTGEAFDITDGATVGRSEDNDICIPNPEGHYVSSYHAEVTIQGRDIYLKDLSSTNGTYVNDRKIRSKRIREGDTIEFADIKFIMEQE